MKGRPGRHKSTYNSESKLNVSTEDKKIQRVQDQGCTCYSLHTKFVVESVLSENDGKVSVVL